MPVKVVGSGHSWNHVAVTPKGGHLINLSRFNRILHLDAEAGVVTLEAGVTINQLNAYLDSHGLALHNLGHIGFQTLSGAISTGTHGSGFKFGVLASHVRALTLVDGTGTLIRASPEQDRDVFHAALCGLGALGVITSITLQVCANDCHCR